MNRGDALVHFVEILAGDEARFQRIGLGFRCCVGFRFLDCDHLMGGGRIWRVRALRSAGRDDE